MASKAKSVLSVETATALNTLGAAEVAGEGAMTAVKNAFAVFVASLGKVELPATEKATFDTAAGTLRKGYAKERGLTGAFATWTDKAASADYRRLARGIAAVAKARGFGNERTFKASTVAKRTIKGLSKAQVALVIAELQIMHTAMAETAPAPVAGPVAAPAPAVDKQALIAQLLKAIAA